MSQIDIIEEFTNIACEYTDAPRVFIKLAGYWIASSTVGRFILDVLSPNYRRPNLFIVLSSIPGRTRRSMVLSLARAVYRRALVKFFKLRQYPPGAMSDVDYEKAVSDTILEEGTAEGITDHLQNTETYHLHPVTITGDARLFSPEPKPIVPETFVMINPEIGNFFLRIQGQTYLTNVLSLFSKLYDGEGGRTYLSQRGRGQPRRYLPWNIYFTCLGAMQEPNLYLDDFMVRQGLMRRILLAYYDVKKAEKQAELRERWKSSWSVSRIELQNELNALGDYIGELMYELDNICRRTKEPIKALLTPKAHERAEAIERAFDEKVLTSPDLRNLYRQSYPEKIVKMAILKALCRRGVDKDGTLLIEESEAYEPFGDFTDPIEIVKQIGSDVDEALMTLRIRPAPVETEETLHELIEYYIQAAGREGISLSELCRKLKTRDTNRVMDALKTFLTPLEGKELPKVVIVFVQKKPRGRPRQMVLIHTSYLRGDEVWKILKSYPENFKKWILGETEGPPQLQGRQPEGQQEA